MSLRAPFIVVHDPASLLDRVGLRNFGIGWKVTTIDGRWTTRPMLVDHVRFGGLWIVVNRRQVLLVVQNISRLLDRVGSGLGFIRHAIPFRRVSAPPRYSSLNAIVSGSSRMRCRTCVTTPGVGARRADPCGVQTVV
jgi:hypothetical protein